MHDHNLTSPQFKEFEAALLNAFRTPQALEHMVRIRCDTRLNEIVSSDNLKHAVYELIEWFEAQGRIDDLVEGAHAENPGNPLLKAFVKNWRTDQTARISLLSQYRPDEDAEIPQTQGFLPQLYGAFAPSAEGHEEALLASFVKNSLRERIAGAPDRPASFILFGDKGYGKTSFRIGVADWVKNQALVVIVKDFDRLRRAMRTKAGITQQTYLKLIRQKTLEVLSTTLSHNSSRRQQLLNDADARRHCWAAQQICGEFEIVPPYNDLNDAQIRARLRPYRTLTFQQWLERLARIVTGAGFKSIYVLVDDIDHKAVSDDDAITMLRPLLEDLGVLRHSGVAFKFFLPRSLRQQIEALNLYGAIEMESLTWDEEQLHKLLSRRIRTSFNPRRENVLNLNLPDQPTFRNLCEPGMTFDIDSYLASQANGSPRTLVDLVRNIIHYHLRNDPEGWDPIPANTIRKALKIDF